MNNPNLPMPPKAVFLTVIGSRPQFSAAEFDAEEAHAVSKKARSRL